MAKKNVRTKANKIKLTKALQTIRSFSSEESSLNGVTLTDLYQVNNSSNDVSFALDFKNFGVAATTDAVLHDVNGSDTSLVNKATGSISNKVVGTNSGVDGKFLNITSAVTASSQTPVPVDLKVEFSISGGVAPRTYIITSATFNSVGDTIIIDISIFFFHL